MCVKTTFQGALIYLTLACFLATLAARKRTKLSRGFWFAGFLSALASLLWRGIHTGHAPMQNLFEFFLCMAASFWPLSRLNHWKNALDTTVQDALLGLFILFPAGFVFDETVRQLPPALQSPLFVPHVGSYVAAYVLLARAALMSLPLVRLTGDENNLQQQHVDGAVRQTVAIGFFLLTLGLLLGSLWGQLCWGHYWAWDPKEMWSLATWLIYAVFFHMRFKNGVRRPRTTVALLFTGLLFILLTLTWINLSRLFSGMHNYA